MYRRTVLVLLGALLMTFPSRAEEFSKVGTVEGITEYKLPNGFRVLLFPDPSKPLVTVNCTIFCGSRHEGYGETGMAHLLEHMVFKGTPTFPDVPKALRDHGAGMTEATHGQSTYPPPVELVETARAVWAFAREHLAQARAPFKHFDRLPHVEQGRALAELASRGDRV